MKRNLVKTIVALFLLSGMGLLSACNTTEGFGRDMSAAGHAVTGAADSTKEQLP